MAIVTTYICDISGKQGDKKDFVNVSLKSVPENTTGYSAYAHTTEIRKLVHYDVAVKLGILNPRSKDEIPEQIPTFESQLGVLLKDYIADMVYDEVATQMNNRNAGG